MLLAIDHQITREHWPTPKKKIHWTQTLLWALCVANASDANTFFCVQNHQELHQNLCNNKATLANAQKENFIRLRHCSGHHVQLIHPMPMHFYIGWWHPVHGWLFSLWPTNYCSVSYCDTSRPTDPALDHYTVWSCDMSKLGGSPPGPVAPSKTIQCMSLVDHVTCYIVASIYETILNH